MPAIDQFRPVSIAVAAMLAARAAGLAGGCSQATVSHVARVVRLGPVGLMRAEQRRRIDAFMSPKFAHRSHACRACQPEMESSWTLTR